MKILNFAEFVNEGWIYDEYADFLGDFEFEKKFAQFLDEYERTWQRLQKDYGWNRESPAVKGQHFTVDIKINDYPDLAEINRDLGLSLDEAELDDYWWRFTSDTKDQVMEDIDEQYGWVRVVGKSGQMLVIWPDRDEEDFEDEVNYSLDMYSKEKDILGKESIERIQKEESDPNFQRLINLGLTEPSSELAELRRDLDSLTDTMNGYLFYQMRAMRAGLEEITEMITQIKKNALANFKSWLTEVI